ncbi:MAG: hypothetical protein ACI8Z7_000322 [Candidatus Nanohaloarchaea archaeon]|jgi:hypothetical protein
MALVDYASLALSGGSMLAVGAVYFLHRRKINSMKEEMDENSRKLDEVLEFEERVFDEEQNFEEFEQDLSDLSERLFHLIKDKYDLEVTNYDEAIDKIDQMEVEDEDRKEALEKLFEYVTDLEYSEEEPSEEQKAMIRQAAFKLIRTTAPALRNQEQDRPAE